MKEVKAMKFSRKREAIRETLANTKSHPSAEWIFARLKPDIPDLSLATVYRNLGEMKQRGEIQSVGYWGGKERFDGNTQPHTHFICDQCGNIDDLDFLKHDEEIDIKAQAMYDGEIEYHSLVFHGSCKSCKMKQS